MAKEGTAAARKQARSATPGRRGTGQARHDEIVQIAGRLFAERGFLATTIRDIADAASILSGSLYHHFASKESIADELLSAYWAQLMDRYEAVVASDADATEKLRQLIGASIQMLEAHEYAVRMILNDWSYLSSVLPYCDANMARIRTIWVEVLRDGVRDGHFDASLDPQVGYRTIMGSISGAGRWFVPSGALTTEQLATQMSDLFLGGVSAKRSRPSHVAGRRLTRRPSPG